MKRLCDHAIDVLRQTGNPAVMFGDSGLLHLIADAAGMPHNAWHTERRVLSALAKTPGELVKRYTMNPVRHGRQDVLIFYLPETAADKEPSE